MSAETIKIKPLGFTEEVEVVVNFICECECHNDALENDSRCNGNTYECGACKSVCATRTKSTRAFVLTLYVDY